MSTGSLTETPYLGRGGTMPSPSQLFQLYREEFERRGPIQRTMFVLTLHPHVTGHRAPMRELDRLIAYMKAKPGVWFATGEQIRALRQEPGTRQVTVVSVNAGDVMPMSLL